MNALHGVEDTLFIPLAARAWASRRFPDYFLDETALSLERAVPDEVIRADSSEYFLMASVARYHNFDAMIRSFIAAHDRCRVVDLGIGLETASRRAGLSAAVFVGIDQPRVIEMRRRFLGDAPNEVLIAGDIKDLKWADSLDPELSTLFIASGVFQYFREDEVLALVRFLRGRFTGCELIFDATTRFGLACANSYVRRTGNKGAPMSFSVPDAAGFAEKCGAKLIESRGFFADALASLGDRLSFRTRLSMKIADRFGLTKLIHLRLTN